MSESRQIGIWFVAGYFFAKSALIMAKVATAFFDPSEVPKVLATIREMVPLVRRLDVRRERRCSPAGGRPARELVRSTR